MDKNDIFIDLAWVSTNLKNLHNCGKSFELEIYDFDGRSLWVNRTCKCGHKSKQCFQLTSQEKGEWLKKDKTGAVIKKVNKK